jgi:hypothetical protein
MRMKNLTSKYLYSVTVTQSVGTNNITKTFGSAGDIAIISAPNDHLSILIVWVTT